MNPQYIQQQSSHYGGQPPNSPYEEPNANFPPKMALNTQPLPPQKSAPPLSQSNQNNLVDQISNISLSGPQKPLPAQNIPTQNNFVNGVSNQNNYPQQGKPELDKPDPTRFYEPLQNSSLPYPQGSSTTPQFSNQQYSTQPPSSGLLSGQNISKSTPHHPSNQNQSNLAEPPIPGQQQQHGLHGNQFNNSASQGSMGGPPGPMPPIQNQQKSSGPMMHGQGPPTNAQNMSRAPLPGQQNNNLSGPPITGQQNLSGPQFNQQQIPQHLSGPPLPGGQNFSGPPKSGQQNLSGPPMMSQQHMSGPPMMGQQNMSGPPIPGQPNLSGPPLLSQQNMSRPPLPGQQSLSGPPLPGQQNLSGPPMIGSQNLSGPPMTGQQNFAPGPYQNQMPGHQPYPSGPPLPGQPNNLPYGMNQGFQQPGFGPGQPPVYGHQPGVYQGGYQANAQTQSKRLDPDNMPNPLQVIQDDQNTKGGDFITNQRGLVPPLVTSKFLVHDQGNASPRFIRSSMYTVPTTADMLKQAQVPFGIILSPMAQVEEGEFEPPIVDMGEIGPVRCARCKAYMCPFMQFIDAGRRFQCMFCKASTEVPQEYFQHLDHTGQRMDRYERPELMLGTYEFVATKEYCKDNTFPKPPAIIFVIEVSYNNIKSGLVNLICAQMKEIIRNLPVDAGQSKSNTKVGFITYNSSVHFYNCKANLAQPQMMCVGDVNEVFMPLLEGFLIDPEESDSTIDSLMAQIPLIFGETLEPESILGPAIQAGLEALKASECAGKLLVFHSSLPSTEAPGKLKNRDNTNVLGTEREKNVLAPQTNFYNTLGQECVAAGCTVDLFLFNKSYIDIATIGQVARVTGGEVYKYTNFLANIDGERLITDIINNISRPTAFDAVMRVRTSTGIRPTDFYGHLHMSNTTDVELASIDSDKAVTIEIKHDDKLADDEGVFIQAALLYTSCSGVRRLRIINLSLKTSPMMSELYRSCDCDAVVNFFLKQSITKLVELSTKTIRDTLTVKCAHMLATYRKHCASPSNIGQLILPECLKLLPLYVNSLLKSDAVAGGAGITIDQKAYVMMLVSSMPITETVFHVYPRLVSLHDADSASNDIPPILRCSIEKLKDEGAYLLENGVHMFLWLGLNLNPQWVQAVFGASSVLQVDTDKTTIPVLDNPLNNRIRDIILQIQNKRRYCMQLTLIRQRDKMETVMRQFLVEDRGTDGSPSYIDYLCHMHKEIRQLLS